MGLVRPVHSKTGVLFTMLPIESTTAAPVLSAAASRVLAYILRTVSKNIGCPESIPRDHQVHKCMLGKKTDQGLMPSSTERSVSVESTTNCKVRQIYYDRVGIPTSCHSGIWPLQLFQSMTARTRKTSNLTHQLRHQQLCLAVNHFQLVA
jgi:hypothetical protein